MSFAFEFDESQLDPEYVSPSDAPVASAATRGASAGASVPQAAFAEASLSDLLSGLPPRLSYSSLVVPGREGTVLLRRDLFDARFQMILDDEEQDGVGADSDLVPGVYEGGLKTWECALDLVSTLPGADSCSRLAGKTIVELGCGTALPSAYLLQTLLSTSTDAVTSMHLCDYNLQVLRLVTLPNLILAWYNSPASAAYRTSDATLAARADEDAQLRARGQAHLASHSTPATGSHELVLDDHLLDAFSASLTHHGIHLHFYSGSWASLSLPTADLVLTAETIYSLDSLPILVDALHRLSKPGNTTTCLAAAKILYFGVGGGVHAFQTELLRLNGSTETVKTVSAGVGRVVLSVRFNV